ncbi:MAG: hypothetical protein AAFW68_14420, partial [Pseudomonadota bacterium]
MAAALNMSHQLTTHRIEKLRRGGYLYTEKNVVDTRKTGLFLTQKGKTDAQKLDILLPQAATAFQAVFNHA